MKTLVAFLCLCVSAMASADESYEDRRDAAELAFGQKSYADAHAIYARAKEQLDLQPEQARWVDFRLADTQWREQATSDQADPTKLDEALRQLDHMVRDINKDEGKDRRWAEVHESLGDAHWRRDAQVWNDAWSHYALALDWWAGQSDLAKARARYLAIIKRIAWPPWAERWYSYGSYGNQIPPEVVENALKIAESADDRAWAHYLSALTFQQRGGGPRPERVAEEFAAALASGSESPWYDDALFQCANWLEHQGTTVTNEDGTLARKANYLEASALYRRILAEFKEGESRWRDNAKQRLDDITGESVGVYVPRYFLPGSEIRFSASWRNVRRVEFSVYALDLARDVDLRGKADVGWLEAIAETGIKRVHHFAKETQDDGTHQPGSEEITLEQELADGAYLLVAKAGGKTAREILLVTSHALTVKTGGARTLAWFCSAMDGAPVAGAKIMLWNKFEKGGHYNWRVSEGTTDTNGIALFEPGDGYETIVFASDGKRQALASGYASHFRAEHETEWRIYAFTDRTAYRPGDTVQWKFFARSHTGEAYANPAGRSFRYTITDARGANVAESNVTLNAFGCAWGDLALTDKMPLGEYRVQFYDGGNHIGQATLFRLEEYKLPEFKVAVTPPQKDGRKQTFLLGETVNADIQADYYFGGPVANATVEVAVRKRPHYRLWYPPCDFPWFYRDFMPRPHYGGDGHVVKQVTIRTDAEGRASISFDTERSGQELEYTIEARVTDSSRREIVGTGSVRVGNQRYFVHADPEHRLRRPGEKAGIIFRALDANDAPISASGKVKVLRNRWHEKSGGYKSEDVLTQTVMISTNQEASFVFTPKEEGYYTIVWQSPQDGGMPVRAECGIWVSSDASRDIGYRHHDGVEIIVDKDTFREGEKAAVILAGPASGRWVLFGVEGENLYDWQIVRLDGAVKLLTLPVTEHHVPNIFLTAASFSDGQFAFDQKQVIVPPEKHYLNVAVTADRDAYEPRDDAGLVVDVTDYEGKPVHAEIALAVADESVLYIQEDIAGDPRESFYGEKRNQRIQTWSTVSQKPLARLPEKEADSQDASAVNSVLSRNAVGYMRAERLNGDFGFVQMGVGAAVAKSAMAMSDAPEERGSSARAEPAVVVRSDFRATALWIPDLATDDDGRAATSCKLPDALTTWRGTARVLTTNNAFGIAQVSFIARLPLICRLQAPRFFVVGDTCTVSAVVNNNTDEPMEVTATLNAAGLAVAAIADRGHKIPPHGEARVDWTVGATQAGEARIRVVAKSGTHADAMEKTFIVHEHGVDKFIADSVKVRGESATLSLDIPAERRKLTTEFTVQVAPSIASSLLEALPYLAAYPYGCTEQTMSRFLPSVVVAKTLKDLGLDKRAVENALPTADGKTNTLGELDRKVKAGLDRLYDFQHDDGGWGWWKDGDGDPFMTAYVLWGFSLARDSNVGVRDDVLERGLAWLERQLVEAEDNPDLQAWELHALSAHRRSSKFTDAAMRNLWEKRDGLNAYSRALLLLATVHYGDPNKTAAILAKNLRNGVVAAIDDRGHSGADMKTAHWGSDGLWWRWSDGPIESTAFALSALIAADPTSDLVEPVVNWMVKNRRGARWSNTRDTAVSILALCNYLKTSKALSSDLTYVVEVNGQRIAEQSVTLKTALGPPHRIVVPDGLVRDGTNEIRIIKTSGAGPLYASAHVSYFSLEEPITPAGNEIHVRRQYYRIAPRPTLLKGVAQDRLPLNDGGRVTSGDRIEVVVTIESENDYEYLVFEDLKPAGFESVAVRSGEPLYAKDVKSDRSRWIHQELRDRKVALFADKLPEGTWEIRYELRAETPGTFHALPVLGHAMYVPDIRANSAEIRVTVTDRE